MIKKISVFIIAFVIIFSPTFVLAIDKVSSCPTTTKEVKFNGLVPICNTTVDDKGKVCDPCDFNMVMSLINKIITFLVIDMATPIFALIFMYAGWLYLSAGGDPGKVKSAKTIIKSSLLGYVIALAAWLIVKAILLTLGYTGPMFLG